MGSIVTTVGETSEVLTAPTVAADGTITVGGASGRLYALRPDGSTWTATLDGVSTGPPTHGSGEVVYVGTEAGSIEARSARDGSRIWIYRANSPIRGPIAPADLQGLSRRVCALLEGSGGGEVLCDVRGVGPDAVTVDALGRLELAARRHGCRVRLRGVSHELLELIELMGLSEVLA